MIKLLNIEINNFLSYKEARLSFENRGLCLIDGYNYDENDPNAAGKSSLVSAIAFALYSGVPRDIKIDEVVRRGCKKCSVCLDFDEDGVAYRIERGRKPNFLRFLINGVEVEDDPQKAIERVIGLSLKTFYRCIYFPQKTDTNYLISNDRDKKEILTNILDDLSIFDLVERKIKEEVKGVKSSLESLGYSLGSVTGSLTETVSNMEYYKEKSENFEEERSSKISSLSESKKGVEETNNELKEKIKTLKGKILAIDEGELQTINDKIAEFDKLRKIKTTILLSRQSISSSINGWKTKIAELEAEKKDIDTGICPKCKQKLPHKEGEEHQALSVVDIAELRSNISNAKTKDEEERQREERVDSLLELEKTWIEKRTNLINIQRDNDYILKTEIPNLEFSINKNKNIIDELMKNLDHAVKSTNGYGETFKKLTEDEVGYKRKVDEINLNIEDQERSLSDLKILEETFGKNGIKTYVFQSIVSELNSKVQTYVDQLFNRSMQLSFENEREKSSGEVVQEFSTVIKLDNEDVSYGSLSGGEQRRMILAVDLALADIIMKRSSKSFNVKFFDESFNELSSSGKETTMYLLKGLAKDVDMVGVIDHSTEFRGIFDSTIKVELRGGVSKIA